MRGEPVLVLDAGTSALRAVSVESDGTACTVASQPWPVFIPESAAPFGREFERQALVEALGRVVETAVAAGGISGIAVTGQREGIVCIDQKGDVIFASPNIDARAAAEGMAIDADRGDRVYGVTGHLPSLMQIPAKLAWLRSHQPAIAEAMRYMLPLGDWLAVHLTGVTATSRTLALENGLIDLTTGAVASDLLALAGMDAHIVPEIVREGTVIGGVAAGGAKGVPVILAGADTQCALAGMGAIMPGDAGVPAGWSAPVQLVMDAPLVDDQQRTWTGLHVVPDQWVLESNAGETGRAWDWAAGLMGCSADQADSLAAASPAGARDVVAVLGPRVMQASMLNAGVGALTLPLPITMSAPDRGDISRAVLESAAFSIRANLEQLEAIAGVSIDRVHLGGGMSRSQLFRRIVCDVLDRPVKVARSAETTAVGAVILASVALGHSPSIREAVDQNTAASCELHPNAGDSATYEDCYERWSALSDGMARMSES